MKSRSLSQKLRRRGHGLEDGFAARREIILFVDVDECIGCRSCETACKQENDVSPGIRWRQVIDAEREINGQIRMVSLPIYCQHCSEPPCIKVCPRSAISKRPEDGIVIVHEERCIGCRFCMWVCPVGAIQIMEGKAEKCTLCLERLKKGLEPACVEACPVKASHVGRVEEMSEMMREKYSKHVIQALWGRSTAIVGDYEG